MDRYTPTQKQYAADITVCKLYLTSLYLLCIILHATGQDEEAVKRLTASAGTKSKLEKPVQDLIKMIFDVESMKKAMVEFEVRKQQETTLD